MLLRVLVETNRTEALRVFGFQFFESIFRQGNVATPAAGVGLRAAAERVSAGFADKGELTVVTFHDAIGFTTTP